MNNIPSLRFKEFNDEWEEVTIQSLAKIVTKQTGYDYSSTIKPSLETVKSDTNIPFIQNKDFDSSSINLKTDFFVPKSVQEKYPNITLDEKSLLVTISGKIGNVGVYNKKEIAFIGGAVGIVKFKNPFKESIDFVKNYLTTFKGQKLIKKEVKASSHQNITVEGIRNFKIKLPSIQEQKKITLFLSSIDKKIEQLTTKEKLLQEYKKGVIVKVFNQKIRFKKDNGTDFGKWEEKMLNQISVKKNIKNKDNLVNTVLTNSAEFGIVNQQDYFEKDIANKDNLTGYFVVEKDDFIYNPRISLFAPVGPMKRNKVGKGVMSPLYTVLKVEKNYRDFYEYYFTTTLWHKYMHQIANFGARHDRMNITNNDFMKMPLPFPCVEEQNKIVNFLSSIDIKINQANKQLQQTKEFKKAILQQMFI